MTTNFTAMTWNLENLFLAGSASGPKTEEVYEQKLANLASTIASIKPDVLAVQEVGDPMSLADLQQRLGDAYPHSQLSTHPDKRGIRVGFLSSWPLAAVEELSVLPPQALTHVRNAQEQPLDHMGRGVLKVALNLPTGQTINVVTTHLKSKLITYPNNRRSPRDENERAREAGVALLRRTVETVGLRVFVNSLVTGNDNPLILMGDLNDGPSAVTTELLLGPEDGNPRRRDKGDDVRLYNLVEYIPLARRFSRIYRKQGEMIDHIMVSHELLFQRRLVDSFIEPIDSINEGVESRRDATFPDHAPVFARFELP